MRTLKKTLALVLVLAMMFSLCVTASADFTDADEITYAEAAEVMAAIGVIEGMPDGSFDAKGTLTRAQAAVMIVRLLGAEDYAIATKDEFADVAANHWAAGAISYCVEAGIINGYGDGNFGPSDALTGYAWAKMLMVALGSEEDYTGAAWQIAVAKDAAEYGIFAGNDKADKTVAATREEAALYALNAAKFTTEAETYSVGDAEFDDYMDAAVFALLAGPTKTIADIVTNEASGTLLEDVHGVIAKDKDSDAFGRPCATYVDELTGGDVIDLAYFATPAYSTTEAVKGGTLYTALGKPVIKSLAYNQNGKSSTTVPTGFAIASGNDVPVGGAGVVTEVYNLGKGAYSIVTYNIFAGYISDWSAATYDKDGDLKTPESVEINELYYSGTAKYDFVTDAFDKADETAGTVVAFTAAYDGAKWEVQTAEAADVVTGKLAKYNTTLNQYTIGEKVYAKNANFADSITGNVGVDKDYFLDANGYIIYVDTTYVAPNYAVVTKLAHVQPAATGAIGETAAPYLQAELLKMDGTTEIVKVATLKGVSGNVYAAAAGTGIDGVVVANTATPASGEYKLSALAPSFESQFVKYTVSPVTGAYALEEVTEDISASGAALTAASAFIPGEVANNKTVFIVRTGEGTPAKPYVYTTYTGYANLPVASIKAGNVVGLEDTTDVAAYVYIYGGVAADAIPTNKLAYIAAPGTYNYVAAPGVSYYEYNVIIDGKPDTIQVAASAAQPEVGKLYNIDSSDANGFEALTNRAYTTVVTEAKEGTIVFGTGAKSYTGDETIYVINPVTGAVDTEATVADLEAGQSVYVTYVKAADGTTDTAYIKTVIAIEVLD